MIVVNFFGEFVTIFDNACLIRGGLFTDSCLKFIFHFAYSLADLEFCIICLWTERLKCICVRVCLPQRHCHCFYCHSVLICSSWKMKCVCAICSEHTFDRTVSGWEHQLTVFIVINFGQTINAWGFAVLECTVRQIIVCLYNVYWCASYWSNCIVSWNWKPVSIPQSDFVARVLQHFCMGYVMPFSPHNKSWCKCSLV